MPKKERFLPGSMRWPGWRAVFANLWNTRRDAAAFPPKVWGYGWSLNFGYALIPGKPLWKRTLVFLLGLCTLLLLIYLLVLLGVVVYYLLTPETQVYTVVLE